MRAKLLRGGLAVLTLCVLLLGGARSAAADRVRVEVTPPPLFVPRAEFRVEDGYYRTRGGHYYHYDNDRDGWHYGRNHEEGVRWEHRHHRD